MDKKPTKYQLWIAELFAQGWTQQDIADFLGCNASQVHRIRTGKTRNPYANTASRLESLYRSVNGAHGGKE